jgi:hypothetical protein
LAAGVNGDTNGGRKLAGDTSFLCLVRTQFHVVLSSCECPTFNSVRVKPRPARTRRLYLIVGHRTMGLNLSTGRGATAAAFERRALRRLSLRPGCDTHVRLSSAISASLCVCVKLPGRSGRGLVAANPYGNLPPVSTYLHHWKDNRRASKTYGCAGSVGYA